MAERAKVNIRHCSNPYYCVQEGFVLRVKPGGVLEKVEPARAAYQHVSGKKVLVEALYELDEGDIAIYSYDYSYEGAIRYGVAMEEVGIIGFRRFIAKITFCGEGCIFDVSHRELEAIYRETGDGVKTLIEYAKRKGLI